MEGGSEKGGGEPPPFQTFSCRVAARYLPSGAAVVASEYNHLWSVSGVSVQVP
jgi:hypothetical protein